MPFAVGKFIVGKKKKMVRIEPLFTDSLLLETLLFTKFGVTCARKNGCYQRLGCRNNYLDEIFDD